MSDSRNSSAIRSPAAGCVDRPEPIQIVILARNEAPILGRTLHALRHVVREDDVIHVVADRCSDLSAQVAAQSGARVWVRQQATSPGKGGALAFWLDRTEATACGDEIILILDADSTLEPGFDCIVSRLVASGAKAIQLPIMPAFPANGLIPRLAAISEFVEHQIFERGRWRLGWPVRLRGTGMVFRRELLERVGRGLRTVVEDQELTLRVVASGEKIAYGEGTCVVDPKPEDAGGVMRQRARWFKGQLGTARIYRREILAIALSGPAGWSILGSLFLRPKVLFLPLLALLAFICGSLAWTTSSWFWLALALSFTLPIGVEALGHVVGVRRAGGGRQAVEALLLWPAYGLAWLGSMGLALATNETWPRVRPVAPLSAGAEPQHAPESSWTG